MRVGLRRSVERVWHSPTLTTWLSLGIRLGGLAVMLPLVLTHLATPEVLVWQMLSTITMMVLWVDFGFGPTFARVIAFARGGGTRADLVRTMRGLKAAPPAATPDDHAPLDLGAVLRTQHAIYIGISVAAMVVAAVVGTATLIRPIANLPSPSAGWIAWIITAFASQLTLLNSANVSILTGFNRLAWVRRIEAANGAAQIGSTCLVILAGGGLIEIVGCYSFWLIPLFVVNRIGARKLEPRDANGKTSRFDRSIFRLIWPAAWRSGIGILMSVGIIQSSGLLYAQFVTPAAAASYLLILRLMTALAPIAQAPFYSKLPVLAELRGAKKHDELCRVAIRGVALAHWTFVVGALSILYIAFPLLKWLGSSVPSPDFWMTATVFLAFFVERYSAMHIQIYSLTHHIVWHIANGITGALMIGLFFLFVPVLGAVAMPAAMLASYLGFCSWYASRLSLQSLDIRRWTFERQTAFWPALTLIAGLLVYRFVVQGMTL
ncbi:polysaccharide biosynthesis protein [Kaistia algarum]|uniref:hypothetical protein n=1 Tax=Kaistia algarum TaxID=2083279 RepID=UPI0010572F3C|nr:hypothetical protein [Kaistia algarum]MCX5515489.1 hypothetical protein [Kaistia algarum]